MDWLKNESLTNKLIVVISLVVPAAVVALRYIPHPEFDLGTKQALYILPLLNACLNGSAFVFLIAALIAIRYKMVAVHKFFTSTAVLFSALFLISYIAFHYTTPETTYGGEGSIKAIYYFVLISHILLSAVIVPLALLAYAHGFSGRYQKHKRIVRFAYPLWLYVTLTGVIVYLMISPYYPH